jgi:DNA polymerase-3 subunit epsilon
MNFVAVDVETANESFASICQVGLARFSDGKLVETWDTLVNPQDEFSEMNVSIHGIRPDMVRHSPSIPDIAQRLREWLEKDVSVCHTHFDRVALPRAFEKHGLPPLSTTWLDSARVVRRTWPEMARSGYGLPRCCERIGYNFSHHDALEDAKACGHVLIAAMRDLNLDMSGVLLRVNQPIDPQSAGRIFAEGNPEGDLYGDVVLFTGKICVERREAARRAAEVGLKVVDNFSRKVTILVVGDQDLAKLVPGQAKSTKHVKAEEAAKAGHPIRIVGESDFWALIESACHFTA